MRRNRRGARASALLLLSTLFVSLTGEMTPASAQVPPLGYQIHTVYGSIDRTAAGTVGVPAAVNVDLSPEPDLVVQAVATIVPSLVLDISVTTLRSLSVAVELIYEVSGMRFHFGYDPRATADTPQSVAPVRWEAIAVADLQLTSLDLNLVSVLPGRTLKIFGRGATLALTNRKIIDVSAVLDPVPTVFRIFGRNDAARALVDLRPGTATKITANVLAVLEGTTVQAKATVDRVPDVMAVEVVKRAAPARPLVAFSSSAAIAVIQAEGQLLDASRTVRFFGRLTGISAPRIEVDPGPADRVSVRFPSGGAIDRTEIGFAQNGAVDTTPPPSAGSNDFVKVVERSGSGYLSAFARVAGLGAASTSGTQAAPPDFPIAELGWGDSFFVKLQRRSPSTLVATVDTDDLTGRAELSQLPAWLHVEYVPNARLFFDGSSGIDRVKIALRSKPGHVLFGRARLMDMTLEGIPSDLDMVLTNTRTGLTNGLLVTARDKSVGLVDVRLADRDGLATVTGDEGVLYVDRSDFWILHARVRAVSSIRYESTGICIFTTCGRGFLVDLVAGQSGRPFKVDVTPNSDQTIIDVSHRPARAYLQFVQRFDSIGKPTRLFVKWNASPSPSSSSMTLRTPAKSRMLRLAPIPTRAEFCVEKGSNYCSNHGRAAQVSVSFTTGRSYVAPDGSDDVGQRLNVEFEQCDAGPCFAQHGDWIKLDNISIERFRLALKEGSTTEVYVDTAGRSLSGDLHIEDGSEDRFDDVDVHLPTGFSARDRLVRVTGTSVRANPSITCPSGTSIKVWIPDSLEDFIVGFGGPFMGIIWSAFDDEHDWADIAGLICKGDLPGPI